MDASFEILEKSEIMYIVFHAVKKNEQYGFRVKYINKSAVDELLPAYSKNRSALYNQELDDINIYYSGFKNKLIYALKKNAVVSDTIPFFEKNVYYKYRIYTVDSETVCVQIENVTENEANVMLIDSLIHKLDEYNDDQSSDKKKETRNPELLYKLISDTSGDGFVYRNYETGELLVSDKFRVICGRGNETDEELLKRFEELFDENVKKEYYMKRENALKNNEYCFEMELYAEELRRWLRVSVYIICNEKKEIVEQINYCKDITDYVNQRDKLEYRAYYDVLTGLYNRDHFYTLIDMQISRAARENQKVYFLYIDIDDFKKINDSLGFQYGDELVIKMAAILNKYSSENISIARFNSDEFVMAIYGGTKDQVDRIYDELRYSTSKAIILDNHIQVYITFSVGVTCFPDSGADVTELLGNSDIAMYHVKENGKNGICYFENDMVSTFIQNVRLETMLKRAIENQKFELYYQPQYDAATQKLRGFEALIRWNDESEGYIAPGRFIPLAEKNGTIIDIGTWVLKQAINDYMILKNNYNYDGMMSVNISAIQFRDKNFEAMVVKCLEDSGMNPEKLELEITESIFIGVANDTIELIKRFRKLGIKISLDDFGTGYSSLSYLKNIAIDTLKIDKSFVDTMINERATNIITSSIISMVEKLGLETIAEGVETDEQLEYLRRIRCNNIQGFLLGKPMNIDNVKSLMN